MSKTISQKASLAKEEWISIFEEAVVEGLVYALLTEGSPHKERLCGTV